MDGLTVVLTYEDGVLAKAVTRGNGEIGEVITPNARTFINIPTTIPYKGCLLYTSVSNVKKGEEQIPSPFCVYHQPTIKFTFTGTLNSCSPFNFCAIQILCLPS